MPLGNFKVVITEQDCIEGCRETERYCIISTAIARMYPESNHHESNINTIRFTMKDSDGKNYRYVYPSPLAAREYILDYDQGKDAHPMEFEMVNPQIEEKVPRQRGIAKTPSFKPQSKSGARRSKRVFGEKVFVPNDIR